MAKIFNVDKLIETISEYIKVKVDILKVDMIERISGLAALIISFMAISMISLFLLAFASLTLGSFLNETLGSHYLGYLIITGFYLILVVVVVLVLKSGKLKSYIEAAALKSMEKIDDDHEQEN